MTRLRPAALFLLAVAAALCGARVAAPSAEDRPTVVVTRIEGELAESMIATMDRAVRSAERSDAAALIVEIDTPGGAVTVMDRIAASLDRSKVSPTTYITREAVSAGAFIAMAGEKIYSNEHAQIGSSYPIFLPFGVPLPNAPGIDTGVQEKTLSYLRSKFRDRAQSHDKPGMAALAEAMVDPAVEVLLVQRGRERLVMTRDEYDEAVRASPGSLSVLQTIDSKDKLLNLTAKEAFELGFTDGIVASREDLLKTMGLDDARIVEVLPSWSEKFVEMIEHVQWFLLVVGLVLLFIETKIPGFGVFGILGCACVGLFLFHNYLIGLAEMQEVLLVAIGLVLIAVEIFVLPGTLIAGGIGVVCLAAGVILSCLPFVLPENPGDADLLQGTLFRFFASIATSFVGAYVLSRFVLPKTPLFKKLVLDTQASERSLHGSGAWLDAGSDAARVAPALAPGDLAVALSDLRPAGKIEKGGLVFDAQSGGEYLTAGTRVRVVRIDANRAMVRADEPGPGGS